MDHPRPVEADASQGILRRRSSSSLSRDRWKTSQASSSRPPLRAGALVVVGLLKGCRTVELRPDPGVGAALRSVGRFPGTTSCRRRLRGDPRRHRVHRALVGHRAGLQCAAPWPRNGRAHREARQRPACGSRFTTRAPTLRRSSTGPRVAERGPACDWCRPWPATGEPVRVARGCLASECGSPCPDAAPT